jgi:hypothetical protein
VPGGDSPYITFYYHSFDGEQGHMLKKLFAKKVNLLAVASIDQCCYRRDRISFSSAPLS